MSQFDKRRKPKLRKAESSLASASIQFLHIALAHFLDGVVGRPGSQGHVGERWIPRRVHADRIALLGNGLAHHMSANAPASELWIEQDQIRVVGRGIHENDLRVVLDRFLCIRIDDTPARGFTLFFVVDEGMHDREWTQGQVARLFRPRQGGAIAAEVAAKRTAASAKLPAHALRATLLEVDGIRLGEIRIARSDQVTPFEFFGQGFLEAMLVVLQKEMIRVLFPGSCPAKDGIGFTLLQGDLVAMLEFVGHPIQSTLPSPRAARQAATQPHWQSIAYSAALFVVPYKILCIATMRA